jgi:FkbM family methyltransferase
MSRTRTLREVDATFGRILAFDDDLVTRQIVEFGAHTRVSLAFLLSVLHAGDTVFDLGGHIGTFAIPMALKVGARGTVVIVEAHAETFGVLEQNLRRTRPAATTHCLHALVAPPGARYRAQVPANNTGATFFMPVAGDEAATTASPITLDALCARFGAPRLVKLDIEGWEGWALASYARLPTDRPMIFVEVAEQLLERSGSSVGQLDRLFRDADYRLFVNVEKGNAAHDRFVVAEIPSLEASRPMFGGAPIFVNVLAIHRADERLAQVVAACRSGPPPPARP